jgi:hypothetical protein
VIVALWQRWTENHRHELLLLMAALIAVDLLIARFLVVPFVEWYAELLREAWA